MDTQKLEAVRYKWNDANYYEGEYFANHSEVKFLIDCIDELQQEKQFWIKSHSAHQELVKVVRNLLLYDKTIEKSEHNRTLRDAINKLN